MSSKLLILEHFLPYRLAILSSRVSRSIAQRYEKKFSLSVPEWRVIAILGENSDLSAVEVSDRTGLDKVAVSRAVKNLLAKTVWSAAFRAKTDAARYCLYPAMDVKFMKRCHHSRSLTKNHCWPV